MHTLDFSSWQALLSTLFGLAVITLIGVSIRLIAMQTMQQRRERENRQINERLRTLIAAYKTLGGSFTGELHVDPTHLGDLRKRSTENGDTSLLAHPERTRRTRDAVEAALSDILLLGTEEQVRLAAQAAADLVAGRPTHTHDLVVSLRAFIRDVLDLDPVPVQLQMPRQGPARAASTGGKSGRGEGGRDESKGSGNRGAGGGDGLGMGVGMGLGGGLALDHDEEPQH